MPNAHLTSAPGKEFHPPMLSMLLMHGVQVKRERDDLHGRFPQEINPSKTSAGGVFFLLIREKSASNLEVFGNMDSIPPQNLHSISNSVCVSFQAPFNCM